MGLKRLRNGLNRGRPKIRVVGWGVDPVSPCDVITYTNINIYFFIYIQEPNHTHAPLSIPFFGRPGF